jgi:hypothetical protein
MATIAVCPGCQTQLGVPPEAVTGAELECPLCHERFATSPDRVRILAMANVAPAKAPAPPAPAMTAAPLKLPPDATIESEPIAAAPPAEVEVDFDLGAISATTPIASQPTVRWEPEPLDEKTPANAASRLVPEPVPAKAADNSHDFEQSGFHHGDFEHDEDDHAVHAMDFDGMAPVGIPAEVNHDFDMNPAPRLRRRRSSPVGSLVGIVGGGGLGLLLAGYALLWLTDPPLDLFRMADWAPTAVLPQSLLPPSVSNQWADEDATNDSASVASEESDFAADPQSGSDEPGAESSTGLLADQSSDKSPRVDATVSDDLEEDPAVTPASASEPVAAEIPEAPIAAPATATQLVTPARWPSTPIAGDLVNPRFSSLADFTASIGHVDAAGRQFLGGDLANKDSLRAMGQAYIQICEVAERYTLTDPAAYGSDLFTKQALAKAVIHQIAGNTKRRQDLNVVAARWWQHAKRSNNGLLLVGRVTDHAPRGQWTEHTLEIAVGDEIVEVPVLMERVLFSTGAEAAVAGAIITNPREQIRGYDGDASQVLISGTAFDPALYANDSTGEDSVIDPLKF